MQSVKTTSHVILKAACKLYLESEDDIKTSRKMRHVRIRNVIYKASRLITNESVAHTARVMGKDHTTVLHALKPSKRINAEFYEEVGDLIAAAVELAVIKRNNILQWDSSTCYNNNKAGAQDKHNG